MKANLGRRYRLSASHRLHTDKLDAAANRAIYGKCNNPYGHGHNYVVEVIVGGEIDPETGMVIDLANLDALARREVLEPFDHVNLNALECFRNLVPTTENLCIEIFRRMRRALSGVRLVCVRVEETSNNFFECRGDREAGA